MLYHFIYGEKTPKAKETVFQVMEDRYSYIYGIFCYTQDRSVLNGSFYKIRNLKIGQDAWFINREWVPCDDL